MQPGVQWSEGFHSRGYNLGVWLYAYKIKFSRVKNAFNNRTIVKLLKIIGLRLTLEGVHNGLVYSIASSDRGSHGGKESGNQGEGY